MLQEHRLEGQAFFKSFCFVMYFDPLCPQPDPCSDTMQRHHAKTDRQTDRQTDEHKHTQTHTGAILSFCNSIVGRMVPRHVMGILGGWVTGNECAGRWYSRLLPTWTLNHINLNPIDDPARHSARSSFPVLAQGFSSKVELTVFSLKHCCFRNPIFS